MAVNVRTAWNLWELYNVPVETEWSPAWKEIFDPPPPPWELSKAEAGRELFGVWEVEEHWHDKLPLISRRVKVPWQTERDFLVFQPDSFSVIRFYPRRDSWVWIERNTPAYGLDVEGAMRVFCSPIDVMKEDFKRDPSCRNGYGMSCWKIKDGLLYFYHQNGGPRQPFAEVSDRPCAGIWRMARRVDPMNDDLGVCQIDPAALPSGWAPSGTPIPQSTLDYIEARKKGLPLEPIDPNAATGSLSSVEQLDAFPEFGDLANDIRNAFPDPPPLAQEVPASEIRKP